MNHYQLPKKQFYTKPIHKKPNIEFNIIYFDRKKKKIIDIKSETNNINMLNDKEAHSKNKEVKSNIDYKKNKSSKII